VDGGSFDAFVRVNARTLSRTAWLLTGDWAMAEDLMQATMMKVWQNWERIGGQEYVLAYVRRTLVNTFLTWRRRRWHGELPRDVIPEVAVIDRTSDADLRESVRIAMAALPPRQRAVVTLRYFNDLSESDTAKVLRCSVSTVKSQAAKALDKLRVMPSIRDLITESVAS
jgi:RNA polymerase sigma-70 factor (sigma-E family)